MVGQILYCSDIATYEMGPALKDWAVGLYKLRCEAEQTRVHGAAAAIKRAALALVGKLAQRNRRWLRYHAGDGVMRYGECWGCDDVGSPIRYRYVGGVCYMAEDAGWAPDANVAMAAWVTSIARLRLWQLFARAGIDHVWYCDTDAAIVDDVGLANLRKLTISQNATLGAVSERHGPGQTHIYGLKHYSIGEHRVCAGIPHGMLTGCGDGIHQWYTPGAGQQCQNGHRPTADATSIAWPAAGGYLHGVVHEDGSVKPIRLQEI